MKIILFVGVFVTSSLTITNHNTNLDQLSHFPAFYCLNKLLLRMRATESHRHVISTATRPLMSGVIFEYISIRTVKIRLAMNLFSILMRDSAFLVNIIGVNLRPWQ